jgi:hypothetical protein
MNRGRFSWLTVVLLLNAACCSLLAQDAAPPVAGPDYKLLTLIGRCRDMNCLNAYREQVGNSKLARIVFYEKWLVLEPSRAAAEGLLHNLPQSESEQLQMMTLADQHEGATESKDDMANLAELYQRWPRSLADAAIALPQYLPEYIRFGLLAPNDPHSDYTGNEERVCRADRARFQSAFERLDRKSQTYLRKTIFDPDRCRAIFFSEAY